LSPKVLKFGYESLMLRRVWKKKKKKTLPSLSINEMIVKCHFNSKQCVEMTLSFHLLLSPPTHLTDVLPQPRYAICLPPTHI
jgi:hypothetical protein